MQSCVVYDFRDGYSFRSGGTFQLKIWKNRGDRAVVSKLMEEHEDGIENRIGLASMTKKQVVATQSFFYLFSPLLGRMIQFDSYISIGLKPPIWKDFRWQDDGW